MKKMKFIISIILCITLLVPITAKAADMKPPGVVSEGLSDVVISICNLFVGYFNEYGVSIMDMLKQGEGVNEASVKSKTTFNLTTVRIEDNKVTNGIFNSITSNFYPKLMMMAIIVFLVGLIYIGVLTLMSAASAKRQEYMQKLNTWFFGLVLMMAFGIVMVFMINLNNKLANTFLNIGSVAYNNAGGGGGGGGGGQQANDPEVLNKCAEVPGNVNILNLINDARDKFGGDHTYTVTTQDGTKSSDVKISSGSIALETNDENFTGMYFYLAPTLPYTNAGGDEGVAVPAVTFYEKIVGGIIPFAGILTQYNQLANSKLIHNYNDIDPGWILVNNAYTVAVTGKTGGTTNYTVQFFLDSKKVIDKESTDGSEFNQNTKKPLGISYFVGFTSKELFGLDSDCAPVTSQALKIWADGAAANDMYEDMADIIEPEDKILKSLYEEYYTPDHEGRIEYALLYAMGVFQVLMLFITYVTRTFMISFLIIVFPAVMAVYSIDKLNDNKSTIFTRWNKEFISNVFTNSMHALSYGIMFTVILGDNAGVNGETMHPIVKVIALWFIIPSGQVLRSIFDIAAASAKRSDEHGLAALAGLAAMGKFGGDKVGSTGNNWRNSAQKANRGIGGGNGGGGGSGDGGSGGGGFLGGGSTGAPSMRRRGAMGLLGAAAGLAGTAAVIGGGVVGGTMAVARSAAAGEDFGEITKAGTAGGVVGAGLTKGGIDIAHAGYHRGAQGVGYVKDWNKERQANAEKKRLAGAFEGQRENLRDFKVPAVRANVENGKTALYRPIQSTGTNATRFTRDGKTYELRNDEHGKPTEYMVGDNGYLFDERTGNFAYEKEAFATVDGDFSSSLGASKDSAGVGSSRFFIPVDNEGYMDLNNIRLDNSVVDEQVSRQFESNSHYIKTGVNQLNNQFGLTIREHESLTDSAVVKRERENLNSRLTSNDPSVRISQQDHDIAVSRLNEYTKYAEQTQKEMATAKTQKTQQHSAAARNFAQSQVLRSFDKVNNVSNI
ncbi:MAG: hypothetical protein ACM3UU_03505 [Ignavibacteriales bacterium]